MVRDRATAEDCAQETFERAYRNWASWRPDAPVEAWLHRIAINVAISDRRHQSLGQAGELIRRLGRPAPGTDPSTVAERSERVRSLQCRSPTGARPRAARPRGRFSEEPARRLRSSCSPALL